MKKRGWIITILIILILITIIYLFPKSVNEKSCSIESDCVPDSCCHAESCVAKEYAPNCDGIICSMVCSTILDCGQARCGCIKGQCEVIENEEKR